MSTEPSLLMKVDLWVTIILAIPLAIVANLLTPRFRLWLDKRSESTKKVRTERQIRSREERARRLKKQFEEVTSYHSDSAAFHSYLLMQLVRIALYGAIGGIYGGLFGMVGGFTMWSWSGYLGSAAALASGMIALFTSLFIFQTSLITIRVNKRVAEYEAYKTEAELALKALEA
jgi:hypothetical protein